MKEETPAECLKLERIWKLHRSGIWKTKRGQRVQYVQLQVWHKWGRVREAVSQGDLEIVSDTEKRLESDVMFFDDFFVLHTD